MALETLRAPMLTRKRYPLHQSGPSPAPADHSNRSGLQDPSSPPMVDPQGKPGGSHPDVNSTSTHDSLDRCLENRVGGGGVLGQHHSQQSLDPGRSSPPHQLPGVFGRHPFPSGSLPSKGLCNPDQVRQLRGSIPDKQAGIQQEQDPVTPPPRSLLSLQPPLLDPQSPPPARAPQRMGGLTVTQPTDKSRVVSLSAQLLAADGLAPQASDRPLCASRERKTADLWLPLSVPNGDSSGRLGRRVEPVEQNLPLPLSRPHPNLPPGSRS